MTISREKAKEIVARKQLEYISEDDKFTLLEEYWGYDDESALREAIQEGEFPAVENALITLIVSTEEPARPLPSGIDPIIYDALHVRLEKVVNRYLESKLHEFGVNDTVTGDVEPAGLCPCCGFYSIDVDEEGLWDICPVCFWENGGDGPNYMEISKARQNFLKFGAINERSLQFIDPEGFLKYKKGNVNLINNHCKAKKV